MALRHVFRRGHAQRRHFLFGQVVGNRQRFEGGERPDHAMDAVLFDQFLGLGSRGRGNAGGVGDDQLDLAARKRVVALLQKHRERELHIDAAGSQRPGLGRQQSDADRPAALCKDQAGNSQAGDTCAGDAADKMPPRYRHVILPGMV